MTPSEYQVLAMRTATRMGIKKDILHASLGLVTEVGELCDHLKRVLAYGVPFDPVNVMEEAGGDTMWYAALLCDTLRHRLEDYFPKQQLTLDSVDRLALDAAFYAAAVANGVNFRAEHDLEQTYDHDLRKLISTLSKICEACGYSLEQGMERNIAKLQQRYPDQFTEYSALNRDLGAERAALSGAGNGGGRAV